MAEEFLFQDEDGNVVSESKLESIIKAAVKSASLHKCRLPLDDEQITSTMHLIGVAKDLGNGDIDKGAEEMRINHNYVKNIRAKSNKVGNTIMIFFITAFCAGVVKAFWEGLKHFMDK